MNSAWYGSRAIGLGIALTLTAVVTAHAQVDSTRPTSERRIPIRKDRGIAASSVTRRESAGEVALADRARVDSLEVAATSLRQRLDSISSATSTLASRSDATERLVNALRDSLRRVSGDLTTARTELSSVRTELTSVNAHTVALSDTVAGLNQRLIRLRNGSLFGNSGFYIGVGTGPNFSTGMLNDIGYKEGLNVTVPIGWTRPGGVVGVRGELGVQTFDGRTIGPVVNPDPKIYTAIGMLTAQFPLNEGKTHHFYIMGGGGAYMFHDLGVGSTLSDRLSGTAVSTSTSETKFGLTGGAGLEFHILGATSVFVQTSYTNVFANESVQPGATTGKNLGWVPLIAGFTLR